MQCLIWKPLNTFSFRDTNSPFAVLDVGYGSKAVILQLKDEIRVVEGRGYARRIDRLDAPQIHGFSISDGINGRQRL